MELHRQKSWTFEPQSAVYILRSIGIILQKQSTGLTEMKRSKAAQHTRNCPPYEILHKLSSIDLYGDIDKQKRKRLRSLGIYEVELLIAQRKDISHRERQSSSTRKWSCNHAIFTKPSHTLYQPLLIVYSKHRLDEMYFITTE